MNNSVDIFILTYNRSNYLKESIESVLKQTYDDFRLIVLDNHSEDNTKDVVNQFTDKRIVYICHEKNIGGTGNFNFALKYCTSRYFVIFHDDDIMLPTMIEDEVSVMTDHEDATLVSGNAYAFSNKNKCDRMMRDSKPNLRSYKQGSLFDRYMNTGDSLIFPSIMYRTDFIKNTNLYIKGECGPCSDVVFYFDIERCGGTIFELGKPVMLYREHEKQDSVLNFYPMHLQLYRYFFSNEGYHNLFVNMENARESTCRRFARRIIRDWLDNNISLEQAEMYLDSFEKTLCFKENGIWKSRIKRMSKHRSIFNILNKLYKNIKRHLK